MNPAPWRKPYRRKGSTMWWARLPVADGSNRERSLLVRDGKQAIRAIDALGHCHEGRFRERSVVYAVAEGRLTVPQFMEAYNQRQLEQLADRLANPVANLNDQLDGWQDWLRSRGNTSTGTRAKYLNQVRVFIPEGLPFPATSFTSRSVSGFLSALGVGAPNRYRAALSSFAKYLVEVQVLASNPVRDTQKAKERAPRVRALSRPEAEGLVAAISPVEARTIHALMCGSGMEIGAVFSLRHRDIDIQAGTVQAHGTKRLHRDRTVRVTERWCWDILLVWLADHPGLPGAPVFRMSYYAVRDALSRAMKAVEVEDYRSHDWRHTYAVQALKNGLRPEIVAHQLGHKTPAMVHAVYGRYVPNATDYVVSQTVGLTVAPNETQRIVQVRAVR